jgi:hypothetical protein
MIDDEPRPVWMMGPVRNPVLQHRVSLFSLVPLFLSFGKRRAELIVSEYPKCLFK